jgi:hypothetical protein
MCLPEPDRFEKPTGQMSRRVHGAIVGLTKRAHSARVAAREPGIDPRSAAALRGKARGLDEAIAFLQALEDGRRLPKPNHTELIEEAD